MAKKHISKRDFLIEQCLQDAYCQRTGDMIEEGFSDWLAGKKAKLGTKMNNLATRAKNAVGRVANATSNAVGATKNAISNAAGAMQHAADNRAFRQDAQRDTARAERLRRRGDTAGADAAAQSAQANMNHANTKFQGKQFQGKQFQGQEYQDANAAEQQAVLKSLSGKIQKLIQEFESKGGNMQELLANLGVGTAESEEVCKESYKVRGNSKSQKIMLENIH